MDTFLKELVDILKEVMDELGVDGTTAMGIYHFARQTTINEALMVAAKEDEAVGFNLSR